MLGPLYTTAVAYAGENTVTLTFSAPLDALHLPTVSAITVDYIMDNTSWHGVSMTVDSASNSLTITVDSVLTANQVIFVAYDDPTSANDAIALQGTDGLDTPSFSDVFSVRATRPGPAAPSAPLLDSASDSGTLGDYLTNAATPTVSGTADADAVIKLYDSDGTTLLGSTTASGTGAWSITTNTALIDGSHTLKVTQSNSSGQTSGLSGGLSITIDTVADAPTALALAPGNGGGPSSNIAATPTPTITGLAEAYASVTLYDSHGNTVGSTTANGAGVWNITTDPLPEGEHTLTAKQVDIAGNVSLASSGYLYVRDSSAPDWQQLDTDHALQSNAVSGAVLATLNATDDSPVSYALTAGPGSLGADNSKFGIVGSSLVAAHNLAAGSYSIFLTATDAAGNSSEQAYTFTVTNPPSVAAIERAEAAAQDVAASADTVTYTVKFDQAVTGVDINDFTLSTTGTASGHVSMVNGSGDTYTVTVTGISGDGALRLDLNASGTGIVNADSTAVSGGYTGGQRYTLDHTAPLAPDAPSLTMASDTGSSDHDAITSNTTPTFKGVAEAHATIALYDSDGSTVLGSTSSDQDGHWEITSLQLLEGAHALTVQQTDVAGNVSGASNALNVVIDTGAAAPGAPVLAAASDSGVAGDMLTNNRTPLITGSAEAYASVKLYDTDGVTVLGTANADASGAWSITTSTLVDGAHTLSAVQTDLAGNTSSASAPLVLTVDGSAPAAPAAPLLAPASDTDTRGDNHTYISQPVFTGTGEANAKVTLYDTDGATVLGSTSADNAGHWRITSSTLEVGVHTLTVTQADAAGNVSDAGAPLTLTIEAAPAPDNTVDGVHVDHGSTTLPDGSSGSQTIVPIVTDDRAESSGSSGVADIPLVTSNDGNLLLAQLSTGFGLTASGGDSLPAGNALDLLIQSIRAATPDHTASDQGHLTGNGAAFLGELAASKPLLVQTITPVSTATAPAGALTLTGTSSDSLSTALVIDASQLASGSKLVLNQVDFAAVIGGVHVTGNTVGQILTGDSASQTFSIGAGSNSQVYAGGGDDTLVLTSAATSPGAAQAQAAAQSGTSVLHGGLGEDSVSFSGASSDYTIEAHAGYLLVTANAQPNQHALLVNVESLSFSDTTIGVQNDAALSAIAGLYQTVLGRQADYLGADWWTQEAKGGASLGQVALDMIASAESQSLHAMVFTGDSAHDIALLYQGIFGRTADADGLAYWSGKMADGATLADVAQSFMTSVEITGHQLAARDWDFQVA